MKNITLLSIASLFFIAPVFAQQATRFDSLLCRSWRPVESEIGGMKIPIEERQEQVSFFSDHRQELRQSKSGRLLKSSTWFYEQVNKTLTLRSGDTTMLFTIIALNDSSLVLDSPYYSSVLRTYFVPVLDSLVWHVYVGGRPNIYYMDAEKKVAADWGVKIEYFMGDCGSTYHYKEAEFKKINQPLFNYFKEKYGEDWEVKFDKLVELTYKNNKPK